MTRSSWLLASAFLLLAGCKPAAQTTAPVAAPSATSTAPTQPGATAPAAAVAPQVAAPSFDCSKSPGEFEQMVCQDPALAALDRQLADTFAQALAKASDKATLQATERGWIKGRDECWKADDKPACVREAYIVRIVDLRIQHQLVAIPSAVEYRCDDNSKPFTATFYNDEPRAVGADLGQRPGDRAGRHERQRRALCRGWRGVLGTPGRGQRRFLRQHADLQGGGMRQASRVDTGGARAWT
jgi:uncharacterized protein